MKISEITEFLENAFDALNEKYFNGELPRVIITVQSSNRGVLGHFTPWDSWKEENTGYKEINISAENLSRPIENVIATLQHENTHFYCNLNNIKDTSRGGVYHNKHFKEQAEKRGLIIDYDKKIKADAAVYDDVKISLARREIFSLQEWAGFPSFSCPCRRTGRF